MLEAQGTHVLCLQSPPPSPTTDVKNLFFPLKKNYSAAMAADPCLRERERERERESFCIKLLLGENSLWGAFQSWSDWGKNHVKYLLWNIYKKSTRAIDKVAWENKHFSSFENLGSGGGGFKHPRENLYKYRYVCDVCSQTCTCTHAHSHTWLNGLTGFRSICIWMRFPKYGSNKRSLKTLW